jgi:hypothetical protein
MDINEKTLAKIAKMPKNKKGNVNQTRSHKFLEENFGAVYTPPKVSFGSKGVDIFNCFDHICITAKPVRFQIESVAKNEKWRPGVIPEGEIVFVQTKSNKGYYGSRKKLIEFEKLLVPKAITIQISWIDLESVPYIEVLDSQLVFLQFKLKGVHYV